MLYNVKVEVGATKPTEVWKDGGFCPKIFIIFFECTPFSEMSQHGWNRVDWAIKPLHKPTNENR